MAVNSNGVFYMNDTNAETLGDLLKQLANILAVPPRSDGRYYLSDICEASSIKKWAKFRPFPSQKNNFASDMERDTARKAVAYGLAMGAYSTTTTNRNIMVTNDWKIRSLDNLPKRIRDFDGYNHAAKDGVNIKGADGYGLSSDIVFEWEADNGDNITIYDILSAEANSQNFTQYALAVVDPFGFIHEVEAFTSLSAFKAYIDGGSYESVNINGTYVDKGISNPNQVPPRYGHPWYIGLMLKTNSTSFSFPRLMYNPISLLDPRPLPPQVFGGAINITPIYADTLIGSAYQGGSRIDDLLSKGNFNNTVTINCCTNDYLFIGATIKNNSYNAINWYNLYRIGFRQGTKITYYSLTRFNASSIQLGALETAGTTNGGSGNLWSDGMLYLNVREIMRDIGSGDVVIAQMALFVSGIIENTVVTPWIDINIVDMGVTLSEITPNATLPD